MLSGRRRLRKRQISAQQDFGWSGSSAASSGLAFWLSESFQAL
jgi:hypothetical protein